MILHSWAMSLALCVSGTADLPDALRSELDGIDHVDGAVFGDGGEPGPFFLLARRLDGKVSAAELGALTADGNPVARALGLQLSAWMEHEAALPALRAALRDRTEIVLFPWGCCGDRMPLANFARLLIHDANRLLDEAAPAPLVDEDHRLALDVELLADDASFFLHDFVRMDRFRLEPHVAELRATLPYVDPRVLCKGIGRLRPTPATRAFLLEALASEDVPTDARLAAASALTRFVEPGIDAAIDAALAGHEPRADVEAILDALCVRRSFEERIAPWLERRDVGRPAPALDPEVLDEDHPLALDALERVRDGHLGRESEAVERRIERTLARMKQRADAFAQEWNTYGDVAPRLAPAD